MPEEPRWSDLVESRDRRRQRIIKSVISAVWRAVDEEDPQVTPEDEQMILLGIVMEMLNSHTTRVRHEQNRVLLLNMNGLRDVSMTDAEIGLIATHMLQSLTKDGDFDYEIITTGQKTSLAKVVEKFANILTGGISAEPVPKAEEDGSERS